MIAAGLSAGLAGWALFVPSICAIAEIASEQTAVEGIRSSTWTPLTGIGALLAGDDAFAGSLDLPSALLGLALSGLLWIALGAGGAGAIRYLLGPEPDAVGSLLIGAAAAVAALIAVVFLLVNGVLQEDRLTYDSVPAWGWWIAFTTSGGLLGVVASKALRALARDGAAPRGAGAG